MPAIKRSSYLNAPFSSETKKGDFYVYSSIAECLDRCEESMEGFLRCRTIGLLFSECGRFYLKDLHNNTRIQVSMVYQKMPPKSTVPPYPVQMFGDLAWKKRPVIFAKIIQMMTPAVALRMKDTLESVARLHRVQAEPVNPLHSYLVYQEEDSDVGDNQVEDNQVGDNPVEVNRVGSNQVGDNTVDGDKLDETQAGFDETLDVSNITKLEIIASSMDIDDDLEIVKNEGLKT